MKTNYALILGMSILFVSCQKMSSTTATLPADEISSNILAMREAGGTGGGVDEECKACILPYPNNLSLPRSGAVFNENEVLVASEPGMLTCGTQPAQIKVWYADEHPLCIGIRQINIKTLTGTTSYNYPVTPATTSASIIENPLFGATDQTGEFTGNDVSVGGGRPIWPALFITDISVDPLNREGDWQRGGLAFTPNKIYGMWKSATRTIDKTRTPNVVTITVDPDPKNTNGWNLAGGQAPPAGTRLDKYGALIAWDVDKLGLLPGHTYRLQFMVHDGDQNKSGGDVGQSCTTIRIPD
jgi:hypothetical protein